MKYLLILIFFSFSINADIIGGQDADPADYPWMVSIYDKKTHSNCGASIIAEKYIITAAHCVIDSDAENLMIFPYFSKTKDGSYYERELLEVSSLHIHEDYKNKVDKSIGKMSSYTAQELMQGFYFESKNDIAILKLKKKIVFSKKISAIEVQEDQKYNQDDLIIRVIGYGLTNENASKGSDILQKVDLRVVPQEIKVEPRNKYSIAKEEIEPEENYSQNGLDGFLSELTNKYFEIVESSEFKEVTSNLADKILNKEQAMEIKKSIEALGREEREDTKSNNIDKSTLEPLEEKIDIKITGPIKENHSMIKVNVLEQKSTAEGDSGGPAMIKNEAGEYKLLGVVSYTEIRERESYLGSILKQKRTITRANFFVSIPYQLGWIRSIVPGI